MTDRAFFCGKTGCGKTTLAQHILGYRRFVVVFDAKGDINWKGYQKLTTLKAVTESKAPRIIYSPNRYELKDELFHEHFFEWIYQRKHTTVFVDEIYSVCRGADYPDSLHACLTRGRSRGVSVLGGAQRPMLIPTQFMSEAEYYYLFNLKMEQDRKKINSITGLPDEALNPRNLADKWFYFATDRSAVISGPHHLKVR